MQLTNLESLLPRLIYLPSVSSTNSELAQLANQSAALENFTSLISSHQTAGRGRLERSWESVPGSSIALSVLLSRVPAPRVSLIPLVAALAVRDSLQQQGVTAQVKWPNDVLVDDLKISGILAELVTGGVVLGIGLNLAPVALDTATSISQLGLDDSFEYQSEMLVRNLITRMKQLSANDFDLAGLIAQLNSSSATVGQKIAAELPTGEKVTGIAVGIEADGRLLVDNGVSRQALSVADIIHLRKVSD